MIYSAPLRKMLTHDGIQQWRPRASPTGRSATHFDAAEYTNKTKERSLTVLKLLPGHTSVSILCTSMTVGFFGVVRTLLLLIYFRITSIAGWWLLIFRPSHEVSRSYSNIVTERY